MTLQAGHWSPWQPPVLAVALEWMIRKKSNVGQHKRGIFLKTCQIQVWSSFTISLVAPCGCEQGADLRELMKGK